MGRKSGRRCAGGAPRPSSVLPKGLLAIAAGALALAAIGCGESSGAAEGATVTAYVAAPLCAGAKGELERHGAESGPVRVRVRCLAPTGERRLDLAAVGANARRATEDSTAVGYLVQPGGPARFSVTILEAAGIPIVVDHSGHAAMSKLLHAVDGADSGSLRESIRENLTQP